MEDQIYISGALTHGNRKEFYEAIGRKVEEVGFIAHVPHLHNNNAEKQKYGFYRFDKKQIEKSCMLVAYVGHPSLGVGSELEMAVNKGIPIILIWQKGELVSRFTREMPNIVASYEFESPEEAVEWIGKYLVEFFKAN